MRKWISTISVFIPILALSACYLIGPPNSKPLVDAGPDAAGSVGVAVALSGSASDADGDELTYSWAFSSQPEGSSLANDSITGRTSLQAGFTPQMAGVYELSLYVSDGKSTVSDAVRITVQEGPLDALSVDLGDDQTIKEGDWAIFQVVTTAPDGAVLSYAWALISAPASSALIDDDILWDPYLSTAYLIPDAIGTYVVRLTVSDGTAEAYDEGTVTVAENQAPVANAGADQSPALGSVVSLIGTASDADDDLDDLSIFWTFTSKPVGSELIDLFIEGSTTLTPSFTPDVAGTYVLTLSVSDWVDTVEDEVMITVTEPNSPPVPNAGADDSVVVFRSAILSGSASDADGDTLSYEWSFASLPAGSARTDADIGEATTLTARFQPDAVGEYQLDLSVSDGAATVTDRVVVTAVGSDNQVPAAYASVSSVAVTPGSSVTFGGMATDYNGDAMNYALAFLSQPAGESLAFSPDFLPYASMDTMNPQSLVLSVAGEYRISFTATDSQGAVGSDEITVTVLDANPLGNTAPVVDAGMDLATTQANVYMFWPLRGKGADVDGDSLTFSWEIISGPPSLGGDYSVANGMIYHSDEGLAEASYIPAILAGEYTLRLSADDGRGFGTAGSGNDQASITSDTMKLTILDSPAMLMSLAASPSSPNIDLAESVSLEASIYDADIALDPGAAISMGIATRPAGSLCALGSLSFEVGAVDITASAEFSPDVVGDYLILLSVTDAFGVQTKSVTVRAIDNSQGGVHVIIN